MEPTTPSPAPHEGARQPPLALIAGLAFSFVAHQLIELAYAGVLVDPGPDTFTRLHAIGIGTSFATLALMVVGAVDLARRTAGGARLGARLVLGSAIALLAFTVVRQYVSLEQAGDATIREWIGRLTITCRHVFTAGLIVAGWQVRAVRQLAAPLAIASLIATPYDFYSRQLYGWLLDGAGRWTGVVVDLVVEGLYLALALAVIVKGAPGPGASGWDRAARALDRTAAALHARIWIAGASILLVLIMFSGGGSPGMGKLFVVGIPAANAIAGIVLVTGVLGAAGLAAPGAPRLRLLGAGAALTWVIAIQSVQVYVLVRRVFGDDDGYGYGGGFDSELAQALPVVLSVVLAAGLVLLIEAVRGIAGLLGSEELRTHASAALITVVLTQLVAIGGPYWLANARAPTKETAIFVVLLAIAAAIGTLVALARLCRAAAAGLRARTDLPTATVVTGA